MDMMPIQNSKFKMQKINFIFCFIVLHSALYTLHLQPAHAASMSNDQYTIDKRSVNIQPFVPQPPPAKQVASHKPYASGTNYTIETNKPDAFSFGTSAEMMDFGTVTATNPVIRALFLSVISQESYQILLAEDHPLKTSGKLTIPDTTCDNGACSEITGALWANALTYGFGYHLRGPEDIYKQFADSSRNEAFQRVFEGENSHGNQQSLTYKVNVSGTQDPGNYTNTVTIIATPDY
jgi:hypothetical protein